MFKQYFRRSLYISASSEPSIKLINANQSSTYGNSATWVASHAIDGDIQTFSVTNGEDNAWCQAELEQSAIIDSVQLILGKYAFEQGMFFVYLMMVE